MRANVNPFSRSVIVSVLWFATSIAVSSGQRELHLKYESASLGLKHGNHFYKY
jgi:hypothetical protein